MDIGGGNKSSATPSPPPVVHNASAAVGEWNQNQNNWGSNYWGSYSQPYDYQAAWAQYYQQQAQQQLAAFPTQNFATATLGAYPVQVTTAPAVAAPPVQAPPPQAAVQIPDTQIIPDLYDPTCPTVDSSPSAPEYLAKPGPKVSFQMRPRSDNAFHQFTSPKVKPSPVAEPSHTTTEQSSSRGFGGTKNWPPSLRSFVERAFSRCVGDKQRNNVEIVLKRLITGAISDGTLWQKDWDSLALPSPEDPTKDNAQTVQTKKSKKRVLSYDNMGSPTMDTEKRQRRSQRFRPAKTMKSSPIVIAPIVDGVELDWDALTIKGTSQALEKQYFRLTSAPDPSTVRPEPVLKKSLKMLKTKWKKDPDYIYTCEQLKSIRQDLTVQHLQNKFAIEVYETHARLALENNDLGEFNQCQTQLHQLYEDVLGGEGGNILEFLAYRILYLLFANNLTELTRLMTSLQPKQRAASVIHHALGVREAMALWDYHTFFRLYSAAPNMGPYIMDLFVDRMRLQALRIMTRAYRPTLAVDFVAQELAFPSMRDCILFLEEHGASLLADAAEIDTRNTSAALTKAEN